MEVNNQIVDPALVSVAAQKPAVQTKDGDKPDFDSMVHQKRQAEKPEQAPVKQNAKENAEPKTADGEQPASDEQYAIAAAMMFQAQPDMRYAIMQPETVEAVETVPDTAQIEAVEMMETPGIPQQTQLPQTPVETAEAPAQADVSPDAAPVEAEAAPVRTAREAPAEAGTKAEEKPETGLAEQPRVTEAPRTDGTRAEEAPEAPRFARHEAVSRTQRDDADGRTAQTAPETALFENVEAPVVKVAEVSRPIPLEAENGVEQLSSEIDGILVNSVDTNRIEVTLTPGELGKLTVEITRGEDGALNIVLSAANERTASLLEKNAGHLQNLLTTNARPEVQIQVRANEETQQQFLNPDDGSGRNRQQQQQNGRHPNRQHEARDFMQQLRLGLVDVNDSAE